MSRTAKRLTGSVLSVLMCCALPLMAAQPLPFTVTTGEAAQMKAFIDPVTGELREPTAEELAAAQSKRGTDQITMRQYQQPEMGQVIRAKNGTLSMVLDTTHLNYAKATVDADGNVRTTCNEHATHVVQPAANDKREQ